MWPCGASENGPFKLNDDLTLDDNPDGWDVSHNLIYVDQPIGTGYSYSTDPADDVHSEQGTSPALMHAACYTSLHPRPDNFLPS